MNTDERALPSESMIMKAQSKVKCIGMIFWKQATVRPVLRQHTNRLVFVPSLAKLNRMPLTADAKLVTWGSRDLMQAQQLEQQKTAPQRQGGLTIKSAKQLHSGSCFVADHKMRYRPVLDCTTMSST